MWNAVSDERTGVSFTTAAGPRQRILGPESSGTHDHILLSQIGDSPQPGGPGSRIYISQKQGGPVIPPSTRFPFRCLLRLVAI
jgi:hypothetical protein